MKHFACLLFVFCVEESGWSQRLAGQDGRQILAPLLFSLSFVKCFLISFDFC